MGGASCYNSSKHRSRYFCCLCGARISDAVCDFEREYCSCSVRRFSLVNTLFFLGAFAYTTRQGVQIFVHWQCIPGDASVPFTQKAILDAA